MKKNLMKISLYIVIHTSIQPLYAATELQNSLGQLKVTLDTLRAKLGSPVSKVTPPPPQRGSEKPTTPPMTPAQESEITGPERTTTTPVRVLPEQETGESVRPFKKPAPRSVTIVTEEAIEPTSIEYVGIINTVQQLEAMQQRTPEQQRAMKNKAISLLMGLNKLVSRKAPNDAQKNVLVENVEKILKANSLGIHNAINLLKKASVDQEKLYQLMKLFFEQKIIYLETEFNKIKPGQPLNFDVRYNIEEAFFYPETIKDELETAQKTGTESARQFSNDMNDLYERLVKLLRANKEKLRAVDVPVEIYERKVAGNPVYCITQVGPGFAGNIYVTIFDNLTQLEDGIKAYFKPHTTQRLREYVIAESLKMLKEIVETYEKSCHICLSGELAKYNENEELKNKTNLQLDTLAKFLTELQKTKSAQVTPALTHLDRLRKILTSPSCPTTF